MEDRGIDTGGQGEMAACVRCAAAVACVLLTTSAMNIAVFPQFDAVFTYARDVSVTVSAVELLALGVLAAFRPAWLRARLLNAVAMACLVAGAVALVPSIALGSAAGLTAASCALALGRGWVIVSVGLAASRLPLLRVGPCVAVAFVADYLVRVALWLAPAAVGLALFLVLPALAWALSWPDARPLLLETQRSEAMADVSVTQPSSFLPFDSQLFACLFLFSLAFGYSLRYGEVDGTPIADFLVLVPVAVVALYVIVSGKRFPGDLVMRVSVLFVVAGFFVAVMKFTGASSVSVTLLSCGSALFDMVAWVTLVVVAGRNHRAAVAAVGWGRGVTAFGTLAGAAVGVAANSLTGGEVLGIEAISGVLILAFVGYALIGVHDFSFERTIEGITPVVEQPARTPEQDFEGRCRAVAERFGLTPRELEVFMMLARGRDRAYIQEQLVVSRNTVKAHVKHIYAKLGIHSHQDLLDLVEQGG